MLAGALLHNGSPPWTHHSQGANSLAGDTVRSRTRVCLGVVRATNSLVRFRASVSNRVVLFPDVPRSWARRYCGMSRFLNPDISPSFPRRRVLSRPGGVRFRIFYSEYRPICLRGKHSSSLPGQEITAPIITVCFYRFRQKRL